MLLTSKDPLYCFREQPLTKSSSRVSNIYFLEDSRINYVNFRYV